MLKEFIGFTMVFLELEQKSAYFPITPHISHKYYRKYVKTADLG